MNLIWRKKSWEIILTWKKKKKNEVLNLIKWKKNLKNKKKTSKSYKSFIWEFILPKIWDPYNLCQIFSVSPEIP